MSRRPRRGAALLGILLPVVLAALAAYGVHRRFEAAAATPPVELTGRFGDGAVEDLWTARLERQWIADAFPDPVELYLAAPPARRPCPSGVRSAAPSLRRRLDAALAEARPDDPEATFLRLGRIHREEASSWLPGLTLGVMLAREGRMNEARTVLDEVAARASMRRIVGAARDAARRERPSEGPRTEELLAAIQLLHASGYVRIETHHLGNDLWGQLKNPIGFTKLLALRGATDRIAGMPSWARHQLRAPGCGDSRDAVTSLDLYNNLIVGYLKRPDFRESEARRRAEFERDYDDPPAENPLLAVLRRVTEPLDESRESWVWAVSNAERLLKQRRTSGLGPLEDPRLACNLAQLMESALPGSPPPVQGALLAEQRALVGLALGEGGRLAATQRPAFHRGLGRLLLLDAVRRGEPPSLPSGLAADLGADERDLAAALAYGLELRGEPSRWLQVATDGGDGAAEALGRREGAWRAAARRDLAAALVRQVADRPRSERAEGAWRAAGVLAPGDVKPAELVELEKGLGLRRRFSPRALATTPAARGLLTALAGLGVWVPLAWLALQLRRRHELMTSFYRLEARRKLKGAR